MRYKCKEETCHQEYHEEFGNFTIPKIPCVLGEFHEKSWEFDTSLPEADHVVRKKYYIQLQLQLNWQNSFSWFSSLATAPFHFSPSRSDQLCSAAPRLSPITVYFLSMMLRKAILLWLLCFAMPSHPANRRVRRRLAGQQPLGFPVLQNQLQVLPQPAAAPQPNQPQALQHQNQAPQPAQAVQPAPVQNAAQQGGGCTSR